MGTPEHPFWSETRQAWIAVGELQPGEEVATADGGRSRLVAKELRVAGPEYVYHLEVWGDHHFHVGAQGVLVHNAYNLKDCIERIISELKKNAVYLLDGVGPYKPTGRHLPIMAALFKGLDGYVYKDVLSVSLENLAKCAGKVGKEAGAKIHKLITDAQGAAYREGRKRHLNLEDVPIMDEVVEIEINAMVEAGIPRNVAKGWMAAALEDFKAKGIFDILRLPWDPTK